MSGRSVYTWPKAWPRLPRSEQPGGICAGAGLSRPPQPTQPTPGGPEEAQLRVPYCRSYSATGVQLRRPQEAWTTASGPRRRGSPDLRPRDSSVRQPSSSPPAEMSLAAEVRLLARQPVARRQVAAGSTRMKNSVMLPLTTQHVLGGQGRLSESNAAQKLASWRRRPPPAAVQPAPTPWT